MAAKVDFYGATYGKFSAELYAAVRREAFGVDIGQSSWLTVDEQDRFIAWLQLGRASTLLDVACGSGGTTLRIAEQAGCSVVGIDLHPDAIRQAEMDARSRKLAASATFGLADASTALPFLDASFEAIICIDAILHLPDREAVLKEWSRVLKSGGRLVFTDPVIVTGPLTKEEIGVRSSIGYFLFVPSGYDEQMIAAAGMRLLNRQDVTQNMADVAARWAEARARHADDLRTIEGADTYEGQQRFLTMTHALAASRKLSRYAFLAEK
jgi:ubiquinone/menaquinone biosynthesis C-methylase UbiE